MPTPDPDPAGHAHHPDTEPLPLKFPPLIDPDAEGWQWPAPPFAWRFERPSSDRVEPCRIESPGGADVDGEMLSFEPFAGRLSWRLGPERAALTLPFTRLRRLTLTAPLQPAPRSASAPAERVPAAAAERDYRIVLAEGGSELVGRSAGHVQDANGLYLFEPREIDRTLVRQFVPRHAYLSVTFGPSAEEVAMSYWIGTPAELEAALVRQAGAPVLPLGKALLAMGLLTPAQIEAMAQRQAAADGKQPLGEMLVAAGLITQADLQTAFGYKMGCPLVDLARFPIDPTAARRIGLQAAIELRALPIMLDGKRLVVAVDRLARTARLSQLQVLSGLTIVPVLARRSHLRAALAALVAEDVWSHVPTQHALLDTLY